MRTLALFVPVAYLAHTRLRRAPQLWGLLVLTEWLPAGLVLVLLGGRGPLDALVGFGLAYGAFITVYEIGYLANDLLAFRETGGRSRLGEVPPSVGLVAGAVLVRLVIFVFLTVVLGRSGEVGWWGVYGLLAAAFTLHNVLVHPGLRGATFVHLATTRILAPVFSFLAPEVLLPLVAGVLPAYVLPRLLAYLESKDALSLPGRATTGFKVRFHAALLLPGALLAVLLHSWIPFLVCLYYLVVWTAAWTLGIGRSREALS